MLLFRDLNNVYNLGFEIILNEQEETSIYKTAIFDQVIGTVGERIYGLYKVIDFREIEDKTYYLISNKNGIVGWVNLINSITLYKKEHEAVKLIDKNYYVDEINHILRFDLVNTDINKVYMSRGFIILNGKVLEAIYLKSVLIGFFSPNDLDHSIKINEKMILDNENDFYLDSGFITKAEDVNKEAAMKIIDFFPNLKIVRVKHKNSILWVKIRDFRHEKLNRQKELLSDLSFNNLFAIHISYSYEQERRKAKDVIKKLIEENKNLLEIIDNKPTLNSDGNHNQKNYRTLYENLKYSKLGKIQIAYWNYLKRRRNKNR